VLALVNKRFSRIAIPLYYETWDVPGGHDYDDEHDDELAKAVKARAHIRHLDVSLVDATKCTFLHLSTFTLLVSLRLVFDTEIQHLHRYATNALRSLRSLNRLDLATESDEGVNWIVDDPTFTLLECIPSLRSLHVPGGEGLKRLVGAVGGLSQLNHLQLFLRHAFAEEQALVVANCWSRLRSLHLMAETDLDSRFTTARLVSFVRSLSCPLTDSSFRTGSSACPRASSIPHHLRMQLSTRRPVILVWTW
jgi:hypothetical protein